MADNGSELKPIIGGRKSWIFRCNRICACFLHFKWSIFLAMLLGQLVGIILFTIRAVDCFFREFRTTATCKRFDLYPMPKMFECFWLLSSSFISLFLIYHVVYRSPEFCGIRTAVRRLSKKKYFYKINFALLIVVVYDIFVMSYNPQTWKTIGAVLFITEKSLTVVLMFLLNFLARFWNGGESRLKYWLYKAALAMYVLQNFLVALLDSTVAAYKVLTVPEPEPKIDAQKPGAKSVVGLMLLVTNNGFRFFVAEFFLSKIFDDELDILDGKTIEKNIDTQERRDDYDDHGTHRMIPTPTKGFEEIQS